MRLLAVCMYLLHQRAVCPKRYLLRQRYSLIALKGNARVIAYLELRTLEATLIIRLLPEPTMPESCIKTTAQSHEKLHSFPTRLIPPLRLIHRSSNHKTN